MRDHRFIKACQGLPVDTTPVWFMRQAGRYQPEYRAIRQKYSLLEICANPELCAEVTILPVTQLGVDAAIIFSDISVLFEPLGAPFEIRENVGPVVHHPIATAQDVDNLTTYNPKEHLPELFESIRIVVNEIDVPLIGFAGAPFTLSSYLIEGGPTKNFAKTRKMMYEDEGLWNALMERLTHAVVDHLRAQADAGASALQVFDSWVGCLSSSAYRRYILPHMQRLFVSLSDLNVPLIHFAVNSNHLLKDLREAGGDVIGVDWRVPIDEAWKTIGFDKGIQGNLDPTRLLGPWEGIQEEATDILHRIESVGRNGHIFNLGHGVLPPTPVDHLKRLVDFVHDNVPRKVTSTPRSLPPRFPAPRPEPKSGVLLMAYGSPASLGDIAPYYAHIRGGHVPRPDMVADLTERYQMIGGLSPLIPTTLSLAHKLESRLGMPVYCGMRHSEPFIADTLQQMADDEINHAVAVTLAPHYSKMSIGAYIKAADEGLAHLKEQGRSIEINYVESWSDHPLFVDAIARRIHQAAGELAKNSDPDNSADAAGLLMADDTAVVFTAHSLPESIRKWDDPYESDLENSCQRVAKALGITNWRFAYQSAGGSRVPWLGPDITEFLPTLAEEGFTSVIVCPIGFVSDHLEIYYDIDIEAQEVAHDHGIRLIRTESFNADYDLVDIIASIVRETIPEGVPHA